MTTLTLPGFEPEVAPAPVNERLESLAARLPRRLRFGTSTWSFPGWAGLVYAERYPRALLARVGLAAYAQHPLLGAAGVDRSYYAPIPPSALRDYSDAVPSGFRFVVKAHEHCTWARFPRHPRFGPLAGQVNPRFLDRDFAAEAVVSPLLEGLGERLHSVVFQFPPQPQTAPRDDARPIAKLHDMLRALPHGPRYAVEIRSSTWLDAEYAAALDDVGAVHCFSVHPAMPPLTRQRAVCASSLARGLVLRWNLGHGQRYEDAQSRYAPFDRLRDPDPDTRRAVIELANAALRDGADATVIVNNKAEGSAPRSIVELARSMETLARSPA